MARHFCHIGLKPIPQQKLAEYTTTHLSQISSEKLIQLFLHCYSLPGPVNRLHSPLCRVFFPATKKTLLIISVL